MRGRQDRTCQALRTRPLTVGELGDAPALRIRTLLNGEPVQDSTTEEMVFSVAEIIAYASSTMTLEPGDLIATGTPAGVGFVTGRYLAPGDEVSVEIERIGTLTNPVQTAIARDGGA